MKSSDRDVGRLWSVGGAITTLTCTVSTHKIQSVLFVDEELCRVTLQMVDLMDMESQLLLMAKSMKE